MPRAFSCINGKGLERRGVLGDYVTARLDGAALVIEGAEGGKVRIEPARVDLIRHFRSEAVHSLAAPLPAMHETKIWWDGGRKPALLMPGDDFRAYRNAIGKLARAVAALHGLERLQVGPGYTTAIINLLIVGLPMLMLFGTLIFVAVTGGWLWWVISAVVAAFFLWLGGRNIVSRWPRGLRSIETFEEALEP